MDWLDLLAVQVLSSNSAPRSTRTLVHTQSGQEHSWQDSPQLSRSDGSPSVHGLTGISESQGHWHCSSVIPLPALCGGISPIARQSLSFLLTEWFLCLGFCASQGARGRCLDSTCLLISAGPNTHSFHGPRRPLQESAPEVT